MAKHEVTVRLSAEARPRVEAVAAELERLGLSEVSVSKRFGMIHGRVEETREDELKRVAGVASVKPARTYEAF